jgi:hypothetical protein
LSKVETERLDFGSYPSEGLIHQLAGALDADEDQLLLLAKKIPTRIKAMVLQRPAVFSRLADLDNRKRDGLLRLLQEK